MAVEQVRGCGFRKVGGLYLCGDYISISCDRLPYPLETCPVCGHGIKPSRGFIKINPLKLLGPHDGSLMYYEEDQPITAICRDRLRPCFVCDPKDQIALIMSVGERYYKTPYDFLDEATQMGISKRLPSDHFPKDLELGKTIVYLAHPKACERVVRPEMQRELALVEASNTGDAPHASETTDATQSRLLDAEKVEKCFGLFSAFIPQRIEKLIWESQATDEELERLEKRGITPIVIPDGDEDHA